MISSLAGWQYLGPWALTPPFKQTNVIANASTEQQWRSRWYPNQRLENKLTKYELDVRWPSVWRNARFEWRRTTTHKVPSCFRRFMTSIRSRYGRSKALLTVRIKTTRSHTSCIASTLSYEGYLVFWNHSPCTRIFPANLSDCCSRNSCHIAMNTVPRLCTTPVRVIVAHVIERAGIYQEAVWLQTHKTRIRLSRS